MKSPLERLSKFLATLALLVCVTTPAHAGMALGPYLIWMNLAADASANDAIHEYTHAEPDVDSCWNGQALLMVRDFPKEITPALVRRAVVLHDASARKRLLAVLHRRDDDIESYDGIVVVPPSAKPTLMSLAASGRIRSKVVDTKDGKLDWAAAFCDVLPPISRKP